jgi:O-antigen/teichoic acid export membrane protein
MKRHFAYSLVSLGSRLLVGLVLFVILARLWGPGKFGLFTFVFSFTTLLVLLVDFGFHLYLLREVARSPSQAAVLIADSFCAKLVLVAGTVAIGLCLFAAIGPKALPPSVVFPLFLTALTLSFSELFVAPLRALGHFDQEAIVVVLANVVQFVLVGVTAWIGGRVE